MKYARAVLAIVTAVVLYVLFSVTSALAGVAGLVGFIIDLALRRRPQHTANIMRAMDALLAALLDARWDGRSTVSKECGRQVAAGAPGRLCCFVCWFTHHFLEKDHCGKEARNA